MEDAIEQRLAAIEGRLDLLTSLAIITAGGLYAKGALGDGAWNELFAAIEASGHDGEDAWNRSRTLRAQLSGAGQD